MKLKQGRNERKKRKQKQWISDLVHSTCSIFTFLLWVNRVSLLVTLECALKVNDDVWKALGVRTCRKTLGKIVCWHCIYCYLGNLPFFSFCQMILFFLIQTVLSLNTCMLRLGMLANWIPASRLREKKQEVNFLSLLGQTKLLSEEEFIKVQYAWTGKNTKRTIRSC